MGRKTSAHKPPRQKNRPVVEPDEVEEAAEEEVPQENLRKRRRGSSSQAPPPPPPPPPPPEPEEEESEEEDEEEEVQPIQTYIKAGMFIDSEELTGTVLINQMNTIEWSSLAQFNSNWYPALVEEFYQSFRYGKSEDGSVRLRYNIDGVQGEISELDLASAFQLKREGASDYPERNYSSNWPIDVDTCVSLLNNGRNAKRPSMAYKYNMTGEQKLVFKVVMDILLPTNSQASELSAAHMFITSAILQNVPVNLPAFILKHITYQAKKSSPHPYGMILSHMLALKGLPVENYVQSAVSSKSRIGRKSCVTQELYWWNDRIWAKWEIFEKFELARNDVWKFNKCSPPAPPKDWLPTINPEGAPTYFSMPPSATDTAPSSSSTAANRPPSYSSLTNRGLLELMAREQWRQTQLIRELCENAGLEHRFEFYFDDLPQSAPVPPQSEAPVPPQSEAPAQSEEPVPPQSEAAPSVAPQEAEAYAPETVVSQSGGIDPPQSGGMDQQ